jgi:glycosyltransferase involved in cell wall biosynthesis
LFPIDWPEPFGLVMIEAMACGTPVLAFRCGSVPEIVEDGLTGRIVSDVEEAVRAIPELLALDRKAIRARFEERFSAARMAADYVKIYQKMLRKHAGPQFELSAVAALSAAANSVEASAVTASKGH